MEAQLNRTFLYHKPSDAGLEMIKNIRKGFTYLHDLLMNHVPPSRERSVALTELETSAMWAIKGIVLNDPASVAEEL